MKLAERKKRKGRGGEGKKRKEENRKKKRDEAAASPDGRARAGPPPTSVGNAEPPAARMPQPLRGGHAPSSPRGPRGKNYMQRAALTKHSGPHLDSEKRLRRCEA